MKTKIQKFDSKELQSFAKKKQIEYFHEVQQGYMKELIGLRSLTEVGKAVEDIPLINQMEHFIKNYKNMSIINEKLQNQGLPAFITKLSFHKVEFSSLKETEQKIYSEFYIGVSSWIIRVEFSLTQGIIFDDDDVGPRGRDFDGHLEEIIDKDSSLEISWSEPLDKTINEIRSREDMKKLDTSGFASSIIISTMDEILDGSNIYEKDSLNKKTEEIIGLSLKTSMEEDETREDDFELDDSSESEEDEENSFDVGDYTQEALDSWKKLPELDRKTHREPSPQKELEDWTDEELNSWANLPPVKRQKFKINF
jgi:hypothetical protein